MRVIWLQGFVGTVGSGDGSVYPPQKKNDFHNLEGFSVEGQIGLVRWNVGTGEGIPSPLEINDVIGPSHIFNIFKI